jgi:hypothetical protein
MPRSVFCTTALFCRGSPSLSKKFPAARRLHSLPSPSARLPFNAFRGTALPCVFFVTPPGLTSWYHLILSGNRRFESVQNANQVREIQTRIVEGEGLCLLLIGSGFFLA